MPTGSPPSGACSPPLTLSFFPDVYEQRPCSRTVSWSRLLERLQQFPMQPGACDKRSLPCWSPASFQEGQPATTEHVIALSCLVLDIDEGADLDASWEQVAPWTAALHTSWSHRPEAPRFRLIFPLAQPVSGDHWPESWRAAVEKLGLEVDRKCVNANRRYLLPARPSEDAEVRFLARTTEQCLDLEPLLQRPRPSRPRHPQRRITVPHYLREKAARRRLAWNPEARARLADTLGATVCGSGRSHRAEGIPCPGCGRSSVWFLLNPERATRARCNHLNSCGWSGPVTDLLGSAA